MCDARIRSHIHVVATRFTPNGVEQRRAGDVNPLILSVSAATIRGLTSPARQLSDLRPRRPDRRGGEQNRIVTNLCRSRNF